ncbi:MAG: MFS transporter [Phaeodactylibacter sp.]|uniref:MFS transporter n=1 Tax=Phaeodactylibacter sp. TaxID=1940289 RepID=UPI0032EC96F7
MKLSIKEKLGYSFGEFAGSSLWQTMMFFLPAFYTDVFLLPATATATLFVVVRIFDALNDPIIGAIADRTHSRWGKFRPYLLWGAFPLGITTVLMFTTPDMSDAGKLTYAYVTYFLLLVFYTLVMVPFNALVGVISTNPEERTSIASYKFVFAYGAGLVVQGLLIPAVEKLGAGNEARGYQLAMTGLAAISVVALFVAFRSTRERIKPDPTITSSLKADLNDIFTNRPWLILFASSIIFLIYIGTRSASVMYYFEYYVGRKDLASIFMVSGTVAVLLGVLPTKYLSKKIGKRNLFIIVLALIVGSLTVNYFARPEDLVLIFATQIVFSLASGPTMPLLWAMLADTADYSEWKNGRRATGLVYSAATMAQKTGVAIGAALMLGIIGQFGYVANVEQTPESLEGIKLTMTVVPALIAFAGLLLLFFYNLNETKLKEIAQGLEARRKSQTTHEANL